MISLNWFHFPVSFDAADVSELPSRWNVFFCWRRIIQPLCASLLFAAEQVSYGGFLWSKITQWRSRNLRADSRAPSWSSLQCAAAGGKRWNSEFHLTAFSWKQGKTPVAHWYSQRRDLGGETAGKRWAQLDLILPKSRRCFHPFSSPSQIRNIMTAIFSPGKNILVSFIGLKGKQLKKSTEVFYCQSLELNSEAELNKKHFWF